MHKPLKSVVSLAVMMASATALAGGFSLYTEGSAVAIGNYAAGVAAEGSDASIGWYNPAGLVLLDEQQAVFSGIGVFPNTKISGVSTFSTPGLPPYSQRFSDLEASKSAFVPAFHYARPLGQRAVFGFSVVSPFGLSTEYSNTSPVRYAATFTELLTANVSPEIGGLLTDNFSVGAGVDLQWSQVKFNRILGAPTLLQAGGLSPFAFDSLSYNKGHSFAVGFHAGVLGMFNDRHTRIGLNYQSKMKHTFHGYSELTGRLADPLTRNPLAKFRSDALYSNDIEFPDVVTLSGYHDVNDRLAILGSVVYTGWDVFKLTVLNNVAAFSPAVGQVIVNSTTVQNYQNAWRFALGANYHVNDKLMMRLGGGYDQTPTIDAQRDVRLPDADRWALSIGAHYQAWPCVGFDAGYTYLFAKDDPTINKTDTLGTSTYNVNATGKTHAHLVGIQAVWTIDKEIAPTK
ncbi:long chain fatty acid transporter [Legionella londiniensis]|uniref:Long chain fatty acid transporter n=2 Tax=Legionella londiniensis TaxID=45068 RepID=A0A0W0VNV5_9GAMM|nr:long chain fatty acid transporter [Legionella londiniensis]STX92672.1 long chain fatty acid transporter [Legionella londiniensis]